jgi:hypothetical protein
MDPIALYERMMGLITDGSMTRGDVNAYLSEHGLPSITLLESNYSQHQQRQNRPDISTGNPILDAVWDRATMVSQAVSMGALDNLIAMLDPELGEKMELHAQQVRREHPVQQIAADIGAGILYPGAAASTLGRGYGVLGKAAPAALAGAAEGAVAGYGHQPIGEETIGPVAVSSAVGGTAGGVLGALTSLLGGNILRRIGEANTPANRLTGRLAELSGDAPTTPGLGVTIPQRVPVVGGARVSAPPLSPSAIPEPRRGLQEIITGQGPRPQTPWGINIPGRGGRIAEQSWRAVPEPDVVREGLEAQINKVGQETFGRMRGSPLSRSTQNLMDGLRENSITRPFVETLRGRAADQVLPAGARVDWNFDDARMMHRRLRELSRLRGMDPASKSDAKDLANLADQLKNALDKDTGGLFSEANRSYARAYEVAEAFNIGLGQRRRAGQTLIEETAGFANEAEIKQILNMFRNNPEARDAFRHGMRQRVYQTSTDVGSNPMIERALIGEGKAKDVVRLLFDEGAEGERAFNEFLRQAKMERSSDRASRALARGAGAAGRASVTRTLPLTR